MAEKLNGNVDVVQVFSVTGSYFSDSRYEAFAALREDGTVVTWGNSLYGADSSLVADKLHDVVAISDIYSNGSQDHIFSGTDGSDNLTGSYASDILWGNGGNDTLAAMGGNDLVFGGTGNNLFIGGEGEGDDTYVGGEGVDTVKYTSALAGITVDLVEGAAYSTDGNDAAAIGIDVLIDIENVIAGNFNDILIGNAFANSLEGGAGDDWLRGGEGADTLDGGPGSDTADYFDKIADLSVTLNGAVDAIVMVGGVAEDTIRNIEHLIGGSGNDTFIGDSADNLFRGGAGNDTLDGGIGLDTADYSDKTEAVSVTLHGSVDSIVTVGGVAEDTIRNIENLIGGSVNETFIGDAMANSLSGGYGDDTLQGGAGNDTLDGGSGSDTIVFRGNLAEYSISYDFNNKTYTVTDSVSGRDGSDLVTGAEFFKFADGVHSVADLIDIVPPYLQSITPSEYATDVAVGADMVFTFTEPVQAGTGSIVISNGTDDIRSISVTDSSQVIISGNTVTINPAEDLATDQEYTFSIPSGFVVDLEANGFQGFTSGSFSTGSSAGGSGITFNTTGTVDGSPLVGENYYKFHTVTGLLAEAGENWFHLDLSGDSDNNLATYSAAWNWLDVLGQIRQVDTGVMTFDDTDPSKPGPESWSATFSFVETGDLIADGDLNSSLDGLPDGIIVSNSDNDAVNVALTWQERDPDTFVVATFDTTVKDQNGNDIPFSGSLKDTDGDGSPDRVVGLQGTQLFDLEFTLSDSAHFQVTSYETFAGRVQVDGSGNPAGLYVSTSIGGSDTTVPTVTTFSPTDAAVGIAVSSDIAVTFSEPIQKGTGFITIHSNSSDGPIVESFNAATSGNLSINDRTLTINPADDLADNTHYFVTFDAGAVKDMTGNSYAGISTYDFTTLFSAATIEINFNSTPVDMAGANEAFKDFYLDPEKLGESGYVSSIIDPDGRAQLYDDTGDGRPDRYIWTDNLGGQPESGAITYSAEGALTIAGTGGSQSGRWALDSSGRVVGLYVQDNGGNTPVFITRTLTADTNLADTLVDTFTMSGSETGRLYDDNSDGTVDRLEIVANGTDQNTNTYALSWSDSTHYRANAEQQLDFGAETDSDGRPITLFMNGGEQTIHYSNTVVNGVLATVDSVYGNISALLTFIDTDNDNTPDEFIYKEVTNDVTSYMAQGILRFDNLPSSVTVVIQSSTISEDVFTGTVTESNSNPLTILIPDFAPDTLSNDLLSFDLGLQSPVLAESGQLTVMVANSYGYLQTVTLDVSKVTLDGSHLIIPMTGTDANEQQYWLDPYSGGKLFVEIPANLVVGHDAHYHAWQVGNISNTSYLLMPMSIVTDGSGSSAADWMLGTSGNDTINAGAGDDFLEWRGGNDVIDAGDGYDTVHLSRTGMNYSYQLDGEGVLHIRPESDPSVAMMMAEVSATTSIVDAYRITKLTDASFLIDKMQADGETVDATVALSHAERVTMDGWPDFNLTPHMFSPGGEFGSNNILDGTPWDDEISLDAANIGNLIQIWGDTGYDILTLDVGAGYSQLKLVKSGPIYLLQGTVGADGTVAELGQADFSAYGGAQMTIGTGESAKSFGIDRIEAFHFISGATFYEVDPVQFAEVSFDVSSSLNWITGTPKDDIINAAALGVANNATTANDNIEGNGGNDTINGGAGNDWTVYSGHKADYLITKHDGVFTVADTRPGSPDGTDTLTGIEHLNFYGEGLDLAAQVFLVGTFSLQNTIFGTVFDDQIDADALAAANPFIGTSWASVYFASQPVYTLGANEFTNIGTVTFTDQELSALSNSGLELWHGTDKVETSFTVSATDMINKSGGAYTLHWIGTVTQTEIPSGYVAFAYDKEGVYSHNDYIYANDGNDLISAGAGDDHIYGNGGNDTIDGGGGNDTVVFSGNYAEYTITHDATSSSLTIADSVSGRDGTDVVTTAENFRFADGFIPTLTAFNGAVAATSEDSEIEISFIELHAQGDEADVDGSVDAFVVKGVSNGTLRIGKDTPTAMPFDGLTNNIINVANHAYWTPATNVNGILNAFAVVARDNSGLESVINVQAEVTVIPVNDAPTLTGFSGTVAIIDEKTAVAITLADLMANGDEVDVDGRVDAFVIKSVTSGMLKIGADAVSALAYDAITNNTVDATHQAFWTPAAHENGTLDAFTAVAQDNSGAESLTAILATVSVTPNDAPVMTRTTSFAAKVDYKVSTKPLSVTTGDVNGDGKADIIEVNYAKNAISLQSKYGITLTRFDYTTGSSPCSLTSADVNGDGKADLIVANSNSDKLSVFINRGNGTFNAKVDYATGLSPHSVTSADVNGDGKADLIVANAASDTLSVLTNKGNGTFNAKDDYATGDAPYSVTAADVNGDGNADLIAANSAGNTISVLINNGNGTFADKADYATGSSPSSVVSADVNGDGKADLVVANSASSTLSVLINNGNGTFADKVDYATGNTPSSVVSADVNGDGHPDLMVTNYGESTVWVLINNGDGTFTHKFDKATGSSPTAIINADINGDGRIDMLVATGNSWSGFANTSPITTTFIAHTPVAVSNGILVYDPDGDGEWNGGTLDVQITAHAEGADSLSLPTVSQAGSGIWLDLAGNKLMAGGTEIGMADAPAVYNGDAWSFSFNASATNALVQDVARAISFNNISDAPGTEDRAVSFTATDHIGALASMVQTVVITPVNSSLIPTTDNTIFGVAGNDTLIGGTGNDLMYGGTGNDLLDGGDGNDILIGRAGGDTLTGGFGDDIFRFTSENDSGIAAGTMDQILDFTHGSDKIDLSGIDVNVTLAGIQAFSHVILAGTDSFTAPGQLQFDSSTGILYGNTDSDATPEFAIQLLGVSTLVESDFV